METRRRMIALAAAAVVSPSVLRRAFAAGEGEADVAIIGAGGAGIAAARTLTEAGKRVVVLEARDRPGGRAFTDHSLGVPFDAGAAFIHFAERNPWIEQAEKFGFDLLPWKGWSHFRPHAGGIFLGEGYIERRLRARKALWSQLESVERGGPDASLAQLAAGLGEDGPVAIRDMAMLSIGENPERVSARDYASLWDGTDRVIPAGYGTLVAKAAEGLPVRYGCPATAVHTAADHVEVATPLGVLKAGSVIVTVPVGVLADEVIRFTPGLPLETVHAIEGIGMGALTKVVLRFDGERFGIAQGDDFVVVDFGGGSMTFEMWPFDRDIVIGTTGGDAGRALGDMGEAGAVTAALEAFAGVVGETAKARFTAGRLSDWWHDPLSQGSYSVARPGHAGARSALARPVAGRVWFCGEATAGGGAMTVGGASLEGRRVAKAILAGTH
jgi:monoamine oxidase